MNVNLNIFRNQTTNSLKNKILVGLTCLKWTKWRTRESLSDLLRWSLLGRGLRKVTICSRHVMRAGWKNTIPRDLSWNSGRDAILKSMVACSSGQKRTKRETWCIKACLTLICTSALSNSRHWKSNLWLQLTAIAAISCSSAKATPKLYNGCRPSRITSHTQKGTKIWWKRQVQTSFGSSSR